MSVISKDLGLPCSKPLLDTWSNKEDAGDWRMTTIHELKGKGSYRLQKQI